MSEVVSKRMWQPWINLNNTDQDNYQLSPMTPKIRFAALLPGARSIDWLLEAEGSIKYGE